MTQVGLILPNNSISIKRDGFEDAKKNFEKKSGAKFAPLYFLCDLQMGPIS
jgi:hypothetical protein